MVDLVCNFGFLTKIIVTMQLLSLNPKSLSMSLFVCIYLQLHYYAFSDVQLPFHSSNDPLQCFKTQMSKLGFSPAFLRHSLEPFFFRTMTLTRLLSNHSQESGSGNDRDGCRGMCVNVSRWAPLKHNAIMIVP